MALGLLSYLLYFIKQLNIAESFWSLLLNLQADAICQSSNSGT